MATYKIITDSACDLPREMLAQLDVTTTSKRTRLFLEKAEREGLVVPCDDLPKSFILTAEYGLTKVYLTALSAATLEKRLQNAAKRRI